MVARLVPPNIAHAASGDVQCRARFRFPVDGRATYCDLSAAHVTERAEDDGPSWHRNAARTRVWRRRGYDTEASYLPGTEGQP